MLLNEIFSTPAPVRQVTDNEYQFDIDDQTYTVELSKSNLPTDLTGESEATIGAHVMFYTYDEQGHPLHLLTGGGNAFKIFSTVFAVINKWLQDNHDVQYIFFSADKGERSRVRLYQRILDQFNIKYTTSDQGVDSVVYIVPTKQFQ